jgi:predicted DNA-binding protein
MPKKAKAPPVMKKTSIKLPEGLWRRLRIRALEEGREAQVIVAELVAGYLEKKGGSDRGKR